MNQTVPYGQQVSKQGPFVHVETVLRRAVAYLGRVQLPHGEFRTLIGTSQDLGDAIFDSSPFTTTFVTSALQELDQADVGGVTRKGLGFLEQQREIGSLWRFYSSRNYKHTRTPPDLDDTACASFALKQAGRNSDNEWAFRYLQDDDGRFVTWFLPRQNARPSLRASLTTAVGEFQARSRQQFTSPPTSAASGRLMATAFDPVPSNDVDPVVNANAVLYLGESKLTEASIDYLVRTVPTARDGEFSLYYQDKLTLLHAVARAYRHSAPSLGVLENALLTEIGTRAASGKLFRSAQSAAMAASVLMAFDADRFILEEAIDAIMGFQREDGSFKEQAFYSGPSEYWGSPELATGFCIEALARYRKRADGRVERRTPVVPDDNWNPEGVLTGPGGVDADWYRSRYPDAVGQASAAAHYAHHGWKEGKDPNPDFSTAWYLSDNPDIAAVGINPLLHYLRQGRMEGRTPVEPEASWNPGGVLTGPEGVDADWYRSRYPEAVGNASAAAHYAHHGWRDGKDPNPRFSTSWYLSDNPDVAAAGINPFLHYLRHGRLEGRTPVEPDVIWNPDGKLTGPDGVDEDWYLARYPVAASHASAAAHYAHHGWKEGKDPNPDFSTAWYLADNPDVAEAGINPFLHYLRHGRMEGRRSAPPARSIIRARDWWPSKITLALAIGFATLLRIDAPVTSSLLELAGLAMAITICAAYVSFINDFSDIAQDEAVGKKNLFQGTSALRPAALISLSLAGGMAFIYVWRDDPLSIAMYAASWVAFSLYSLRPFRFKERAHIGVIADACGAHLFPALLAIAVVSHLHGATADFGWFASVGLWSLCLGLRSVISHQVDDERNDAGADINSYVRCVGNTRALAVSEYLLLPLEILGFASILVHVGGAIVGVIFAGYVLVILANRAAERNQTNWSSLAALNPYYALLFPLSLLLSSARSHPYDLMAIALFMAVIHSALLDAAKALYGQTKRAYFPDRLTFRLEKDK